MGNTKRKKNKSTNIMSKRDVDILYLIPILLIMCILPFIIRYKEYEPKLNTFSWFSNDVIATDLFLYYKQVLLIIFAFIALILLIRKCVIERKINIPKGIYLLITYNIFIIISTVMSPYRYWGFTGVFEQFESIFAHISYLIIILYCINIVKHKEQIEKIMKYFSISAIIMLLVGFFQGLKLDVVTSKLLLPFIFPTEILNNVVGLNMGFEKGMVYMTLYNPNYVGVYLVLVLPILVAMFFRNNSKNHKIIYGISIALVMFNLIKSDSAAGIITLFIFSFITILFLRKKLFKNKKTYYFFLLSLMSLVLFLGYLNINKIKGIFINNNSNSNLEQIVTDDILYITYLDTTVKINYYLENNYYIFDISDINNNEIEYINYADDKLYKINLNGWENVYIKPALVNDYYSILIKIDNSEWCFTNQTEDGTFYYISSNGKLSKLYEAEFAYNRMYDRLASGRGYIWNRTIPLLKDNILLGNGADSFIFTFPHYDYVNAMNNGFVEQVINKPHNIYMQIASQSGLISLALYIVYFIIYIYKSFKIYWNSPLNLWSHKLGLALFISVLSYLFISLANDSSITVTPIFWCIVGLSLCINRLNVNSAN